MQRIDWQKYEPFQVICNRRDRSRSRRVIHPRVAAKSAQSVLPIQNQPPASIEPSTTAVGSPKTTCDFMAYSHLRQNGLKNPRGTCLPRIRNGTNAL